MKAILGAAGAGVLLCFACGAYSQTMDPAASPGQPMAQQPTQDPSAGQTPSDTSMGGMRMGTYDSGRSGRTGAPCVTGLSCDIYQGS